MNHARSSTRLRSSSSRTGTRAIVLLVLSLLSACAGEAPRRPTPPEFRPGAVSAPQAAPAPEAPWQTWISGAISTPEFAEADELARRGELEQAVSSYSAVENASSADPAVKEEAFIRRVGTMLKLGQSRQVLTELSDFAKSSNRSAEDLGPRVSLIAAFAYEHQAQFDQTLAWLGLAAAKSGRRGPIDERAMREAERLIRAVPQDRFDSYAERWAADRVIGPLFEQERQRRARTGGGPERNLDARWFSPETYRRALTTPAEEERDAVVPGDEAAAAAAEEGLVLGAVIPLSGEYAAHGQKVKEGIELALADLGATEQVKFIAVDTGGDPAKAASAYDDLAQNQKADFVLGPLLVKDAEAVAERSKFHGIPVLTFTKKPGVTALGKNMFQLGATLRDQAFELASYAAGELQLKRVAVLAPDDSTGREFSSAFTDEAKAAGMEVVASGVYRPRDTDSMSETWAKAVQLAPQAVFVPDALENIWSLLDLKRQNSEQTSMVFLGPALWDDVAALRGLGQLIEGAVYVTPFFAQSNRPAVTTFVGGFQDRFGREPNLLSAQAYDAARLVVKAMLDGENQGELVKRLRETQSFSGVTGRLSVRSNGEVKRRMSVIRVSGGSPVEVLSGGEVVSLIPDADTPGAAAAETLTQ